MIRVRDRDAEEPADLELSPGATVVLEAVDADSAEGSPGSVSSRSPTPRPTASRSTARPTFVDHPTTDADGKLHVVMDPGRRQFFPDRPPMGLRGRDEGQPDARPRPRRGPPPGSLSRSSPSPPSRRGFRKKTRSADACD